MSALAAGPKNPEAITLGLSQSRMVLPYVTRPYFLSKWCQRETVTALTCFKETNIPLEKKAHFVNQFNKDHRFSVAFATSS